MTGNITQLDFQETQDNSSMENNDTFYGDGPGTITWQVSLLLSAQTQIWRIVPPVLLLGGTAGNVLTIVVIARSKLHCFVTSIFLMALAATDMLVLWSGLLRYWIKHVWSYDVREVSSAGCRIHLFLTYASLELAAWILVAVTLERFLSVWFPFAAKRFCTPRRSTLFLLLLTVAISGVNMHWFWTYGVEAVRAELRGLELRSVCSHHPSHKTFTHTIFPLVDLMMFAIIPGSFMIIFNVLIIIRLIQARDIRRDELQAVPPPAAREHRPLTRSVNLASTSSSVSSAASASLHISQLTIMLLAITATFVVCTIPVSVYMILGDSLLQKRGYEDLVLDNFVYMIVILLQYVNNAVNFLMYCMSGKEFRRRLKELVMCSAFWRRRKQARKARRAEKSRRRAEEAAAANQNPSMFHPIPIGRHLPANQGVEREQRDMNLMELYERQRNLAPGLPRRAGGQLGCHANGCLFGDTPDASKNIQVHTPLYAQTASTGTERRHEERPLMGNHPQVEHPR